MVKEYGFNFVESLTHEELTVYFADYANEQAHLNPEVDSKGKNKPVVYPFLIP